MQSGGEPRCGTHGRGKGGSTAERSPQIPRGGTPQVAEPQQAENRHQSDRTRSTTTQPIQFLIMKTENTHTAGSRTIERATAEIDRHTEGHTLSAIASSITPSRGRTARTSAPSADIRGGVNTTLRTPFADAPARIAAWSWKRCALERAPVQRERVFLHRHYLQAVPSDTLLLRQVPIQRQGREPSIPFMKWCKGGFRPKAQPSPSPDCVVCPYFTTTYGRNTATWRYARTTNSVHTI